MTQTTLFIFIFCAQVALAQLGSSSVLKTLKPHEDIRIEYHVLRQDSNIKHGRYRYYYRGALVVDGMYHAGKMHGKWVRKYLNGNTHIEANYLNGKTHGKWIFMYPDGTKEAMFQFVRGQKEGFWYSYARNGQLTTVWQYANDTLAGLQGQFYLPSEVEDGATIPCLKEEVNIIRNDPNLSAKFRQFYPNGKLYAKFTLIEGKMDGLYEKYFKSGILWAKARYDRGRLISIYDWNNPVGRDAPRGGFRGGNGELNYYNFEGKLNLQANYLSGKLHGKFTLYKNEKPSIVGYFTNGKKIGTWRFYESKTSKNELKKEVTYLSNDSTYNIVWLGNAKSRLEFETVKGIRNGILKQYDALGKQIIEAEYKKGFYHGYYKAFQGNRQLDVEGIYLYGVKILTWKYYNDFGRVIFTENYKNKVQVDESFFRSDSAIGRYAMEHYFYGQFNSLHLKNMRMAQMNDVALHLNHYLKGPSLIEAKNELALVSGIKNEFAKQITPNFPVFVPREMEKRNDVLEDFDLGLILESLHPKRLKNKKDKTDPKVGIIKALVEIDEFGFVKKCRIVRGVDPYWDAELIKLFSVYQFWEPALLAGVPIASTLEINVPIEYNIVKKLD